MKTTPEVHLIKSLYETALKLRTESERMLFLAVFSGLGTISSVGAGYFAQLVKPGFRVFIVGTILSSALLIPLSLLLGVNLWDKLKKSRALSGDEFAYTKYLREEYEQDIKEIQALHIAETEKKLLTKKRYEKYQEEREMIHKSIGEQMHRQKQLPPDWE